MGFIKKLKNKNNSLYSSLSEEVVVKKSRSETRRVHVTIDAPVYCQRCHSHETKIMLHNSKKNMLVFICENCRLEDNILRDLPIKYKN